MPSSLAAANLSLLHLPSEVLHIMLGWMSAPVVSTLAVVSNELHQLACDDELWRRLVLARYEPVRWALPDGSLTPQLLADAPDECPWQRDGQQSQSRAWFRLYVSLALPGPANWRSLAAAHASSRADETCWLVLEAAVYDVTDFKHRHPGMAASLELFGGTDATEAFREVPHSQLAHRYMHTLEVRSPQDGELLRLPPEDLPALQTVGAPEADGGLAVGATTWLDVAHGVGGAVEWLKAWRRRPSS